MTLFNKMKIFKKSLFSKKSIFEKTSLFRKKWLFEKFHFVEKCHRIFFQEKKVFSWKFSFFSLFMISHPQDVQCWASNSSTYTFGHGLCVRHFFKNPKNTENPKIRTDHHRIFVDLGPLKKTIAIWSRRLPKHLIFWQGSTRLNDLRAHNSYSGTSTSR